MTAIYVIATATIAAAAVTKAAERAIAVVVVSSRLNYCNARP